MELSCAKTHHIILFFENKSSLRPKTDLIRFSEQNKNYFNNFLFCVDENKERTSPFDGMIH